MATQCDNCLFLKRQVSDSYLCAATDLPMGKMDIHDSHEFDCPDFYSQAKPKILHQNENAGATARRPKRSKIRSTDDSLELLERQLRKFWEIEKRPATQNEIAELLKPTITSKNHVWNLLNKLVLQGKILSYDFYHPERKRRMVGYVPPSAEQILAG